MFILSYWYSSAERDPEKSDIFKYFGGNGELSTGCIKDGPFTVKNGFTTGKGECLKRCFNDAPKISPFFPVEAVRRIVEKSTSFKTFSHELEYGVHNSVHANIGGSCGSLTKMNSPDDPIFWIHHSYIDYQFSIWQSSCGERHDDFEGDLNEKLPGFSFKVKDVMFGQNNVCHLFEKSKHDSKLNINCKIKPKNENQFQKSDIDTITKTSQNIETTKVLKSIKTLDQTTRKTLQKKQQTTLPQGENEKWLHSLILSLKSSEARNSLELVKRVIDCN